jgi:hypothetical protein
VPNVNFNFSEQLYRGRRRVFRGDPALPATVIHTGTSSDRESSSTFLARRTSTPAWPQFKTTAMIRDEFEGGGIPSGAGGDRRMPTHARGIPLVGMQTGKGDGSLGMRARAAIIIGPRDAYRRRAAYATGMDGNMAMTALCSISTRPNLLTGEGAASASRSARSSGGTKEASSSG